MRDLIDSIFSPVLGWLDQVSGRIGNLSVPLAKPIDLDRYLGHLAFLGPHWKSFIGTVCALAFIYFVAYIIVANLGLISKFKNLIKWW